MSTPIKPCPFCGSAEVYASADYVECGRCTTMGPSAPTTAEAITTWNAAPRTPSAPPANTVRVRVAVSVSPSGDYTAAGYSDTSDDGMVGAIDHAGGNRLSWIVANVPKPEPAAEVEASVEGDPYAHKEREFVDNQKENA